MSPIECAARAMHANVNPDWDWADPDAELLRQMYRANVRVALAAIREPTHPMKKAASDQDIWAAPHDGPVNIEKQARTLWQVMIDTALAHDGSTLD